MIGWNIIIIAIYICMIINWYMCANVYPISGCNNLPCILAIIVSSLCIFLSILYDISNR